MQINTDTTIVTFESWGEVERETVTILRTEDRVSLMFSPVYRSPVSLTMGPDEARALGADIAKLVTLYGAIVPRAEREGMETRRRDPESGLAILVTTTNRGEPFREGISIEFRREDYEAVAYIELDGRTALALSKALT
jgi:hypothetical protein